MKRLGVILYYDKRTQPPYSMQQKMSLDIDTTAKKLEEEGFTVFRKYDDFEWSNQVNRMFFKGLPPEGLKEI